MTARPLSGVRRRASSRRLQILLVAAAVGLVTAACGSSGDSSASPKAGSSSANTAPQLHLKVGYTPGFYLSNLVVAAKNEGFFTKNNLDVSLVPLAGSSLEAASLASGSIDVMSVTADGALPLLSKSSTKAQAIAGSSKIFFLVGANNTVPEQTSGTPAEKLAALKGKTVLVSGFGSPYFLMLGALKNAGMSASDVKFANVTHGPPTVSALESNRGQYAVSDDQDMSVVMGANKGHIVLRFADPGALPSYLDGVQDGAWWSKTSFVESHGAEVNAFRTALAQTDAWSHKPENLASYEKDMKQLVGTAVPDSQIEEITKATLNTQLAYISTDSIAAWYRFSVENKTMSEISNFNAADYIAPGTPQTQADADALAAK